MVSGPIRCLFEGMGSEAVDPGAFQLKDPVTGAEEVEATDCSSSASSSPFLPEMSTSSNSSSSASTVVSSLFWLLLPKQASNNGQTSSG